MCVCVCTTTRTKRWYQFYTNANPNYGTLVLLEAPKGWTRLYVQGSIAETLQKLFEEERVITCTLVVAMAP